MISDWLVQIEGVLVWTEKTTHCFKEVMLETNLLSGRDFDYFYISTTVNVSELKGTSLEETSLEETPKTV